MHKPVPNPKTSLSPAWAACMTYEHPLTGVENTEDPESTPEWAWMIWPLGVFAVVSHSDGKRLTVTKVVCHPTLHNTTIGLR